MMERDITIRAYNYCIGAKPIQQIAERYKEQFEKVRFVDKSVESTVLHVSKEEVAETIPLFEDNVNRIYQSINMDGIRDNWKSTKQNYSRIDNKNAIDYNDTVISAYALGTTPIHTFLLRHIITNKFFLTCSQLKNRDLNIVCLCGGSGAELLAFLLSCQSLLNLELHITIIDKEPLWASTIETLTKTAHNRFRDSFSCRFVVMDLLDETNYPSLISYLQQADLCTMVYGVSELLDYTPQQTDKLLSTIATSLSDDAYFLVVDPLSHQFCCEKEQHIQSIFFHHSFACKEEGHSKVSVTRSLLEPFIQPFCDKLHLQINRDVKLSCHVWFQLFQKSGLVHPLEESLQKPERILVLTHLPCVNEWTNRLRTTCHTNVWQLRDASDGSNNALYARLLASWHQYGGVVCLPYSIFLSLTEQFIHSPTFVILHNYDYYLDTVKNKRGKESSLWTSLSRFSYHTLLVTCLADLSNAKYGIEYAHSIERDIHTLHKQTVDWETRDTNWVARRNAERGLNCVDTKMDWAPTEIQQRMLDVGVDNNMKTYLLIHPALVFDPKMISPKQADSQIVSQLQYLAGGKEFDPSASQRIAFCIDIAMQNKQEKKKTVILCRLLPSINAIEKAIQVINATLDDPITWSTLHSFKKTQSKTQYKQSHLSLNRDILLLHFSCVPFLELDDRFDTILLFESSLGDNKPRETNEDAISVFYNCNCNHNVTVIRLYLYLLMTLFYYYTNNTY